MEFKHKTLTQRIIQAFYTVYNNLGYGFLEKVYENALLLELKSMGFLCEKQKPVKVLYKNQLVGEYYADIIVNNMVILELKAVKELCPEHENQLINYLKATKIEVGLLLNFGPKPQFKRKVYSNELKRYSLNYKSPQIK
ncbi:MAG: GxxExxY protein [Marinifilaceae bacterium]